MKPIHSTDSLYISEVLAGNQEMFLLCICQFPLFHVILDSGSEAVYLPIDTNLAEI